MVSQRATTPSEKTMGEAGLGMSLRNGGRRLETGECGADKCSV